MEEQESHSALLKSIRRQLEFYFSATNIARDKFFQSCMQESPDGQSLPISVLLKCNRIAQLLSTSNCSSVTLFATPEDYLRQACAASKRIEFVAPDNHVDKGRGESMIRPRNSLQLTQLEKVQESAPQRTLFVTNFLKSRQSTTKQTEDKVNTENNDESNRKNVKEDQIEKISKSKSMKRKIKKVELKETNELEEEEKEVEKDRRVGKSDVKSSKRIKMTASDIDEIARGEEEEEGKLNREEEEGEGGGVEEQLKGQQLEESEEKALRRRLSKYGRVSRLDLPRFHISRQPKGFAFVEFKRQEAADLASHQFESRLHAILLDQRCM